MRTAAASIVLALAALVSAADGKSWGGKSIPKIRRAKVGKVHKDHDPVHVVVNKVG